MIRPIRPGDMVAFNTLDDATWWDVVMIEGFKMVVREHGTDYAPQNADTSMIKKVRRTGND